MRLGVTQICSLAAQIQSTKRFFVEHQQLAVRKPSNKTSINLPLGLTTGFTRAYNASRRDAADAARAEIDGAVESLTDIFAIARLGGAGGAPPFGSPVRSAPRQRAEQPTCARPALAWRVD